MTYLWHSYHSVPSELVNIQNWNVLVTWPRCWCSISCSMKVPEGVTVLMSASRSAYSKHDRVFQFSMEYPVPAYLVALVAGDLQHVDIGPRLVGTLQWLEWEHRHIYVIELCVTKFVSCLLMCVQEPGMGGALCADLCCEQARGQCGALAGCGWGAFRTLRLGKVCVHTAVTQTDRQASIHACCWGNSIWWESQTVLINS